MAQPVQEHQSDYEVELAIVIGKDAKDVPESQALNYVLGYTGANDVSTFIRISLVLTNNMRIGVIPKTPTDYLPMVLLQIL